MRLEREERGCDEKRCARLIGKKGDLERDACIIREELRAAMEQLKKGAG